ncbi:hypothetical protein D9757_010555 [Collybiopsis confluens]|uniref:Auxin efflux carrier n=1 Tax=Collybiopsis confluens TaxID=2823264 RepID=A0A8H5GY63_9AGAR|nr:hypothetical protein D9757_010555 [Collybiopsis confluens]
MPSSIVVAFLGALEASASVLLTIFYGGIAAYFGLISNKSSIDISRLAVNLFLPCLLFVNLGSDIGLSDIHRFTPIIVWSLAYNLIALFLGSILTRMFKLPRFVTSAVTFNNTTSLPLLLLQSFGESGALSSISGGDTKAAISRAQAYFLLNASISNILTFSLGPRLMSKVNDGPTEEGDEDVSIVEGGREMSPNQTGPEGDGGERVPLLAKRTQVRATNWARLTGHFLLQFWNPTFIGACIGIFAGLVPVLHHHFFDQGGIFLAWLTVSLKNLGNLFASLQVVVVGVKLHSTFAKIRQGEGSGSLPIFTTACILVIRFIIMPAISIPIIYALAAKTRLLADDPILWFCMMMMPVGPTALRLTSLADVSKADESEKMTVAKFLALSYFFTPMICLAAVGSLKATELAGA